MLDYHFEQLYDILERIALALETRNRDTRDPMEPLLIRPNRDPLLEFIKNHLVKVFF